MTNDKNRVVITGMGIVSPIGSTVASFWENLLEGCSGIIALGREFEETPVKIGGYIQDFEPEDYFDRKEVRRISRTSQLAVVAAEEAIEQSGLSPDSDNFNEIGTIVGSSIGGFSASEPHFRDYYLHETASALVIPKSMNSSPAANISIRKGFKGPQMAVDAACASAAQSVGYVYHLIRSGSLEIAITGGADSPFTPAVMTSWHSMRALSRWDGDPRQASRPFSGDRDGMVLGEGAGILVLESEASARRRAAVILAEVTGFGASSDSFHLTQPSLDGPVSSMNKAIQDAGLETGHIDYINAHGTATVWNDRNETAAIKEVFGARAKHVPVVANKANFGHSISGSGALELIGCVKSIHDQVVPPTINLRVPDPECDLDFVPEGKRPHQITHALSNSFAFGGSNATLIVSKYEANGR